MKKAIISGHNIHRRLQFSDRRYRVGPEKRRQPAKTLHLRLTQVLPSTEERKQSKDRPASVTEKGSNQAAQRVRARNRFAVKWTNPLPPAPNANRSAISPEVMLSLTDSRRCKRWSVC